MQGIGQYHNMIVESIQKQGIYLKEDIPDTNEHVLMPGIELDGTEKVGDRMDVFIYLDSEDRPIATLKKPKLTVGEFAPLLVKDTTKIGAFLDIGLPKDILLPFREMTAKPKVGQTILARLYIDKTGRLCASMKDIYPLLRTDHRYAIGDEVKGRVYEFGHDFGTFVAVSDLYSAMIPRHENTDGLNIGDEILARITGIKPDGKIDLSIREDKKKQIEIDADTVLFCLEEYAGVLPFSEKADANVIKRETGLSKAAFKRAVGYLYKRHFIDISKEGKITQK